MVVVTEHAVAVEGSTVRFACAEGDTLLRAALRAGIGIGYECNSGSCGSCRYELVDGTVRDRRPDAPGLSARDRRKGRLLACQSEPTSDCVVKVGSVGGHVPVRPVRRTATLRTVHQLTHDMAEFVFVADRPARFRAGQYAMVGLPGVGERAYSMSNLANPYGEWRFIVKRVPGGAGTRVLFDDLRPGEAVALDGPYGHAYLRPDDGRPVVCVAGGSGIGAMISIVTALAAAPEAAGRTVHLFYGARGGRDLFRPPVLELAAARLGALHYHQILSEPEGPCGPGIRTGFVHEAVTAARLGAEVDAFIYYAAGPPVMTDALARSLVLGAGVPADRLHYDRFL